MSLLTSGKLVPAELVESLVKLSPKDLESQPYGPLLLVLGCPENPTNTFLRDLVHSVLLDAAPLSHPYGWLTTSEMPTMRVPSLEVPDEDQVELLAELDSAIHCIVPLRAFEGTRSLSIGRAAHSEILVSDPSVSGQHAEITIEDGGVRIRDCGSKNGTLVNGAALEPGASPWLQPMDRLNFGRIPAFTCDPRTLRAVLRYDLRHLL